MQNTNKFGINITLEKHSLIQQNVLSLELTSPAKEIMEKEDNKRALFQFVSKILNEHGQINNINFEFDNALIEKDFAKTLPAFILIVEINQAAYTDQIEEAILILNKTKNFIKEIVIDEVNSNEMNEIIIKNALEM